MGKEGGDRAMRHKALETQRGTMKYKRPLLIIGEMGEGRGGMRDACTVTTKLTNMHSHVIRSLNDHRM